MSIFTNHHKICSLEGVENANIDKETLENYRRRFKLHKGDTHEWSNLPDKEFLYMIGAVDRSSDKLTLAGLLMFGYNRDITKIKPSFFLDYREIDDTDVHKSVRERTCKLPYPY